MLFVYNYNNNIEHSLSRIKIALVLILALMGALLNQPAIAEHNQGQAHPHMLVLVSAAYGRKGIETFNEGVIKAWQDAGNSISQLSFHYLDLNQDLNQGYKEELAQWIIAKEQGRHFDYVLLVQQDAVDFYKNELSSLAPKAKVLASFAQIDDEWLKKNNRQGLNMANALDFANTLKTAMLMFPETERIVVVSGATQSDKEPLSNLGDIKKMYPDLNWEYTDELSFDNTLQKLRTLPSKTIVMRSSYGSDPYGKPQDMTPIEIGITLTENTKAPSFVLYHTAIGNVPVIGGHVVIPKVIGEQMITTALKKSTWGTQSGLQWMPIVSTPVYDISEILKWQGNLHAIPKSTIRINEPPSFWRDHGETALYVCLIFSVLGGFLFALLIERRIRIKTNQSLVISKTQLLTNLEYAPHLAVQWFDKEGFIQFWNPASTRLYGWKKEEVIGKNLTETFLIKENAPHYFNRLKKIVKQGDALTPYQVNVQCKDGSLRTILTTSFAIPMANGEMGFASMDLDITAQQATEKHLSLMASVFQHASEGILICDDKQRIEEVNDAFCKLSGFSREELLGKKPEILAYGAHNKNRLTLDKELQTTLFERGHWSGETTHQHKDGKIYTSLVTVNAVCNKRDNKKNYIALLSDITALKEQQIQLERMAHYDAVTGLPNRTLLSQRLNLSIQQLRRHPGEKLAVLYIDLDGFKAVNDNHGHMIGDLLLKAISERMLTALRETDTLARLGGDEFAAVLTNLHEHQDAERVLNALLTAASSLIVIEERELRVSASIGVVFLDHVETDSDPDQLLRQADQAMYKAKSTGKSRFCFFDDAEHRLACGRQDEINRLKIALQHDEFELFYQPKVDTHANTLIGVEALIRWHHPEKGCVPPNAFLPLLTDHPLSIEIGYWVIETALVQLEHFKSKGLTIPISVNVDGFQLSQPDFLLKMGTLLSRFPDYQAGDLEFEILESSALDDIGAINMIINTCKAMGIAFALDDFGTGYSSLNYLKQLPVQTLKIDQSFIRNMLNNPDDLAIIQGVMGLANAFGRRVIAEGVETEEHTQILHAMGCNLIQGYVLSKPLPVIDMLAWHEQWRQEQVRKQEN